MSALREAAPPRAYGSRRGHSSLSSHSCSSSRGVGGNPRRPAVRVLQPIGEGGDDGEVVACGLYGDKVAMIQLDGDPVYQGPW